MTSEFTVESFKPRVRGPRSDKGKNHSYPEKRNFPNLNSSVNVQETNLSLNVEHGRVVIMSRKFKGTPAMREYWREQKRKQRAEKKEKKEEEKRDD